MAPAPSVDWFVWRLALDRRIGASAVEIRRSWTVADAAEAHLALDVAEDMAHAAHAALTPPKAPR